MFATGSHEESAFGVSRHRHRCGGLLRLAIGVAVAIVVASTLLGAVFWALGLVFHLLGLALKVAVVVAVAAWVWRTFAGRRDRIEP